MTPPEKENGKKKSKTGVVRGRMTRDIYANLLLQKKIRVFNCLITQVSEKNANNLSLLGYIFI